VLRGEHDGLEADRLVVFVAQRHLALRIRAQPRKLALLAHFGLLLHQAMRERDRRGNEHGRFRWSPIALAHRLVKKQAEVRKKGKLAWLRPDAKSQVTLRYEDDKPVGLEAVVLSHAAQR